MKKNLFAFSALFLIYFPLQNVMAQQIQPVQEYNRWGLKSIGFSATYGGEQFFEPITFAKLAQNSGSNNSRIAEYFELPPGATDHGSRYLDDTPPLGLGLQLA